MAGLEKLDYLHGLVADYERLREDPERWNQYVVECLEWDELS